MRLFFLIGIFAILNLAGCNTPPVTHKPIKEVIKQETVTPAVTSDVDSLLQYANYLRKLNANDLTREFETVKQKPKSDSSRMELATLYSVPGLSTRDDIKALAILDPLSKETSSSSIKNLALVMMNFITENKRLEEGLQTTNSKLKDEQKQSAELQQKLEALKSIEKSLSERDRFRKPVTKSN